jgi:hypothetical protein
VVARVATVAVAVVVLGWLVAIERDLRLQASAEDNSRHGATPAQLATAADQLERARFLNPDRGPDVARAVVERSRGDAGAASALLDEVVRAEPDNLLAWGLLALYARGSDPAALRRAFDARRRLDPLSARG